MKRSNPPCLILSNYSPEEAYPNLMLKSRVTIEALLSRLLVVHVTPEDPLDLNWLRAQLALPLYATTPATVQVAHQQEEETRPAVTTTDANHHSLSSTSSVQTTSISNQSGLPVERNSTSSPICLSDEEEEEEVRPQRFLFEPYEKKKRRVRKGKEALSSSEEEEEIQRRKRLRFRKHLSKKIQKHNFDDSLYDD